MLGVDPGTINMGYGVLDDNDAGPSLVSCGVLKAPSSRPIPERLHKLYNGLRELIEQYSPDEVAVEEPFVHKSVRSAMLIGQANAVALLAAAQAGSGVFSVQPQAGEDDRHGARRQRQGAGSRDDIASSWTWARTPTPWTPPMPWPWPCAISSKALGRG